jgi:hypothetical protein
MILVESSSCHSGCRNTQNDILPSTKKAGEPKLIHSGYTGILTMRLFKLLGFFYDLYGNLIWGLFSNWKIFAYSTESLISLKNVMVNFLFPYKS